MRSRMGVGIGVLALPALLWYAVMVGLPLLVAVFYSLTDWNGVSRSFNLVGLDNYLAAFGDREIGKAFWLTLTITVVGTVLVNIVALPLAVLLDRRDRITLAHRAILFSPTVVSLIVIGIVWQTLLSTDGIVNKLGTGLGLKAMPFLGEPFLALVSLVFVSWWANLGLMTILYLAALQSLPADLYEASRLDGAGSFQQFRFITIPQMLGVVVVNVLLLMTGYLRLYDLVVVLTKGGPAGSTQTLAYLTIQNAFPRQDFGYGSANGILLLLLSLVAVAVVYGLVGRRWSDA